MGMKRRKFLATSAGTALAATAPAAFGKQLANVVGQPETLVKTFYDSLNEQQRELMCFGFDHELRSKVDNNWRITKASVGKNFDKDQQAMIRQIFRDLHSEEYADAVYQQVAGDGGGDDGFGKCSVGVFGEPGTGKFEFVLTGRHCTRRCDGDSVEGSAFGGPIFYGHASQGFNEAPDHPGNAYWFQAKAANKVFASLDGAQRKQSLYNGRRPEKGTSTVDLTGNQFGLPGIALSDLSADQKELVMDSLGECLAPFRKADRDESMKLIKKGGTDNLHLAYYQKQDLGDDQVWDVWQIEGPSMVWYFRGAPHVHAWAHIKDPANVVAG